MKIKINKNNITKNSSTPTFKTMSSALEGEDFIVQNTGQCIVYILEIHFKGKNTESDEIIHKIGITKRKIQDRVHEITYATFLNYRYFPYVYPVRFSSVKDGEIARDIEKKLHEKYKEVRYIDCERFDGYTELFKIKDIDNLKKEYDKLTKTKK